MDRGYREEGGARREGRGDKLIGGIGKREERGQMIGGIGKGGEEETKRSGRSGDRDGARIRDRVSE